MVLSTEQGWCLTGLTRDPRLATYKPHARGHITSPLPSSPRLVSGDDNTHLAGVFGGSGESLAPDTASSLE